MAKKNKRTYKAEIITLIFISAVLLVGFTLGNPLNKSKQNSSKPATSQELPISSVTYSENSGVLTNETQVGENGKNYKYQMEVPSEWKYEKNNLAPVTLKNGDYSLEIVEEYEGFTCDFSNSKNSDDSNKMVLKFYKILNTNWDDFKIGYRKTDTEYVKNTQFYFCKKNIDPNTKQEIWQSGSKIGLISITAPLNYSQANVNSAINIVAGIQVNVEINR